MNALPEKNYLKFKLFDEVEFFAVLSYHRKRLALSAGGIHYSHYQEHDPWYIQYKADSACNCTDYTGNNINNKQNY